MVTVTSAAEGRSLPLLCVLRSSATMGAAAPPQVRRLRRLARQLGIVSPVSTRPTSGGVSPAVMRKGRSRMLADAEMQQFLSAGYLAVRVDDLPAEFHENVYQKTKNLYRADDGGGVDFGNNIFPAVSELGQLFQSPSIVGTLSSILGENYCMVRLPTCIRVGIPAILLNLGFMHVDRCP